MKKLKVLMIVIVIAMALMGVGYGTWTDQAVINVTITTAAQPERIGLGFCLEELGGGQGNRHVTGIFYYILSNGETEEIPESRIEKEHVKKGESKIFEYGGFTITFINDEGTLYIDGELIISD